MVKGLSNKWLFYPTYFDGINVTVGGRYLNSNVFINICKFIFFFMQKYKLKKCKIKYNY